MAGAILTDAPEVITSEPGEDASDAFLRAFTADADNQPSDDDVEEEDKKKAKPETEETEETSEETPEETEETDDSEETEESETDEEPTEKKTATRVVLEQDADAVVKHKVDGKEIEIPVKDLTRLYGQEAALTRKSQEAAEARKAIDEAGTKYKTGLETLLQRALDAFKPYADINFLALAKDPEITAEDLAALQKQAGDKYADVQFLTSKLDETVQQAAQARHTNLVKAAGDAWKVLADPTTGIPGWSTDTYNEVRTYAKAAGIPAKTVDELVDPVAVKLLHKAMLYDKMKAAPVVKTTKVDKEPKRILKSASEAVVRKTKSNPKDASFARLTKSGSVEDAADFFLAQMQS